MIKNALSLGIAIAAMSVLLDGARAAPPGYAWQTPRATLPRSRFVAGFTYDSDHQHIVLWGGGWQDSNYDAYFLDDTWFLEATQGLNWSYRVFPPDGRPTTGWSYGTVYDTTRGRVVLCHGHDLNPFDIWEFDGDAWVERSDVESLDTIAGNFSLAFDPGLQKTLLFGGEDHDYHGLDETYAYDGITWEQVRPDHHPPELWGHWMAYDSAHSRVVLSGGQYLGPSNATWEWYNSGKGQWDWHSAPDMPFGLWGHQMAFDADRKEMVVFGGLTGFNEGSTATLLYDGSNWTELHPAVSPKPRFVTQMAFDPGIGKIVLYGGLPTGDHWQTFNDLWTWDGSAWKHELGPYQRYGSAIQWGSGINDLVMFGGRDFDGELLGDTWVHDGKVWRPGLETRAMPAARRHHALASDEGSGLVVLFGGEDADGNPLDDTWTYGKDGWRNLNISGPSARSQHCMCYDPSNKVTLLFGGLLSGDKLSDEMWQLTDGTWKKLTNRSLPARRGAAMALDRARKNILLFGGFDSSGKPSAETWVWGGSEWKKLDVKGPTARAFAGMVYDEYRKQIVLCGGINGKEVLADSWAWDGKTWSQDPDLPIARHSFGLGYDHLRGRLVLVGGLDSNGDVPDDDLEQRLDVARADCNCDGAVDFNDIDFFVTVLIGDPDQFRNLGGSDQCWALRDIYGDVNQDLRIDFDDIDAFVDCLINNGCP